MDALARPRARTHNRRSMRFTDNIRLVVAPPHPAGRPFLLVGLLITLAGLVCSTALAWLGLIITGGFLYFFRDPERTPPGRPEAILAPADGRVISIEPQSPPAELGLGVSPRWRVSTFLTVLNVHVNRVPSDGRVTRIAYRHGRFHNASSDEASGGNERNGIAIRRADGRELAVVQVAGLIARRIVCDLHEGQEVTAGARFGIIRFGSRTDLYLPEGVRPLVATGQTMIGGETVVAELPS